MENVQNIDLTHTIGNTVLGEVELLLYKYAKSVYKGGESKHTVAILEEDFYKLIEDINKYKHENRI